MAVPDYESLMLPILVLAGDRNEHTLAETREVLANQLGLSGDDLAVTYSNGKTTVWAGRVGWAKTFLHQAGLLRLVKRGRFQITDEGREVLARKPSTIDVAFLKQFPSFMDFVERSRGSSARDGHDEKPEADQGVPEEVLERAIGSIRSRFAVEILDQLKAVSPAHFERIVVDLLVKMGYGGSRSEAGQAIGRSGDEGIDGVINEDRLGLDIIYIQAKRWQGTVGRPEVQRFVGALHGKRARKGVLITTGVFSSDAREYVSHIDPKVVLIAGEQMAQLMIDLDLGVTPHAVYEIKRIDSDFFQEE